MADEQRGEIQIHDDVGEVEANMEMDEIRDKEIKEKHDDVRKGGGIICSMWGGLSLTVRVHNRRIHDCPPFSPWRENELNPC